MEPKKKSPTPEEARLGTFVCVNKQMINDTLSQFKSRRKSKKELVLGVFFDLMRRFKEGGG